MKNERVKVYLYTRVSTVMQIDGYSLEAQKSKMKAYDKLASIYAGQRENTLFQQTSYDQDRRGSRKGSQTAYFLHLRRSGTICRC